MREMNRTTYTSSNTLDYLMNVKSGVYDKTVLTYTYFINYESYFVKTKEVIVESYYDNQVILDAVKKAGFKNVMIVDKDLNPIDDYNYAERIHVVAMKK